MTQAKEPLGTLVQFEDGSLKAQLGLPDMKLPIQYALGFPNRIKADFPRFSFAQFPILSFEQPDLDTFTNLKTAFEALEQGGNMPCIINAANEVAVAAFLNDEISFLGISSLIQTTMQRASFIQRPSLEDYIKTDAETRILSKEIIKKEKM